MTGNNGIRATDEQERRKKLEIDNKEITLKGKFVRTAQLRYEWDEDVESPEMFIRELAKMPVQADLFTFAQRLPDSRPQFDYFMEWDSVAALPIVSYEHWLTRQIHVNARNKVRKALKQGVEVRAVEFDEQFVRGIMEINNECEFRQGHRYSHFGRDFESTWQIYSTFLDRASFAGAYLNGELIGFVKLVRTDRFMRTMGIISKIAHRDKGAMNLLVGKAVEMCVEQSMPYLVYGKFKYGKKGSYTLRDFKRSQGFESVIVPRYFIPLSVKGRIVLSLNLQDGLVNVLPLRLVRFLRGVRNWVYAMKERTQRAA